MRFLFFVIKKNPSRYMMARILYLLQFVKVRE